MMFAIDMESAEVVNFIVQRCIDKGLLSYWFLSHPESFRLSPPLTISEEEVDKGIEIMLQAMDEWDE